MRLHGDGPEQFSQTGLLSSIMINQKPLGQRNVAGDDSTGRLGFPNPLYTGHGTVFPYALSGGSEMHDSIAWRNHFRKQQSDVLGWDTNVLMTQQLQTRTPLPSTEVLPVFIAF